jgi:hypothetical protein
LITLYSLNFLVKQHKIDVLITLMKIRLGKIKVMGMSVNDPNKFTKSPMKGKAAVTNVLNVKRSARRRNLRLMFSFELMLSSSLRNLVSSVS